MLFLTIPLCSAENFSSVQGMIDQNNENSGSNVVFRTFNENVVPELQSPTFYENHLEIIDVPDYRIYRGKLVDIQFSPVEIIPVSIQSAYTNPQLLLLKFASGNPIRISYPEKGYLQMGSINVIIQEATGWNRKEIIVRRNTVIIPPQR